MKQEYIVEELRNPEAQQNINCRISTYFFRMITLEPCLFRMLTAHDSLKRLILCVHVDLCTIRPELGVIVSLLRWVL